MTWKSGITLALAGLCLAGTAAAQYQVPVEHAAGRTEQSLGAEAGSAEPHGPEPSRTQPTQSRQTARPGPADHRSDSGRDTTLRPWYSGSTDYRCNDSHALRDCTGSRRTASLSRDWQGRFAPPWRRATRGLTGLFRLGHHRLHERSRSPARSWRACRRDRARRIAPRILVHRCLSRRARAGSHLPSDLAIRRARRTGHTGRRLLHRGGGRCADRRRPQRGRPERLRQCLPASTPRGRQRVRQPQGAAVPVSRVDVRPRRMSARGAALRPRARIRSREPPPLARQRRHVGPVRHSRISRPAPRCRASSASCPPSSAEAGCASTTCASAGARSGRRGPTGRS